MNFCDDEKISVSEDSSVYNNTICDQVCESRSYLHKKTYLFYHIYLLFCVGCTISVSFIEFLRTFCVYIYDEIFDEVLC